MGRATVEGAQGISGRNPAADLLRYKQWLVYVLLDPSLATTPNLLPELVKRFRVMTPFIEFLNRPLAGKPRPEVLTHHF